jgi:hypothetical protein
MRAILAIGGAIAAVALLYGIVLGAQALVSDDSPKDAHEQVPTTTEDGGDRPASEQSILIEAYKLCQQAYDGEVLGGPDDLRSGRRFALDFYPDFFGRNWRQYHTEGEREAWLEGCAQAVDKARE